MPGGHFNSLESRVELIYLKKERIYHSHDQQFKG